MSDSHHRGPNNISLLTELCLFYAFEFYKHLAPLERRDPI